MRKEAIMPWMEVSKVSSRLDFVLLALEDDANIRALCRQYGISPTTGYKWIHRYLREGVGGLLDQSRRPHTSFNQTPIAMEQKVLELRDQHPAWGGRKIHRRLNEWGVVGVPPPSTITEILKGNGFQRTLCACRWQSLSSPDNPRRSFPVLHRAASLCQ